jgi:hypothetical protein
MDHWIVRSITLAALALLLALGGCTQTALPSAPTPATSIPSSLPSVHEVAQTTVVQSGTIATATATCPQGEFALGGGWNVPVQSGRVMASHRSGPILASIDAWTVTVVTAPVVAAGQAIHGPALPTPILGTIPVTVYVECLRGTVRAANEVVQDQYGLLDFGTTNLSAPQFALEAGPCPLHYVRVGGGFDFSASTNIEYAGGGPHTLDSGDEGWIVTAVDHELQVTHSINAYIVCLSDVVTAASRLPAAVGTPTHVIEVSAVGAPTLLGPGDATGGATVSCKSGAAVASGGFLYEGGSYPAVPGPFGNPYLSHATSTGWQVAMHANGGALGLNFTESAVCLAFSPFPHPNAQP